MDDRLTQAKALLAQLEALGVAEVQEQCAALEFVIADLEAKAVAEAEAVKTEAVAVVADVAAAEESFVQKYGIGTAHTVEIILLAIIALKLVF